MEKETIAFDITAGEAGVRLDKFLVERLPKTYSRAFLQRLVRNNDVLLDGLPAKSHHKLKGGEKVLEVGTGSGYQTAILAELARRVISVERIATLAEGARCILESLGYKNVDVRLAGETLGWPEEAPYDAIMVTAGAPHVPESLLAQLAIGGRMVIPVGSRYLQELCKVTRQKRKNVVQNLGGCRFVSLVGQDAWRVEDEEGKFPQQD
jgi:protein-L-isoaspartate(D-aspartate) O-methyltransferase